MPVDTCNFDDCLTRPDCAPRLTAGWKRMLFILCRNLDGTGAHPDGFTYETLASFSKARVTNIHLLTGFGLLEMDFDKTKVGLQFDETGTEVGGYTYTVDVPLDWRDSETYARIMRMWGSANQFVFIAQNKSGNWYAMGLKSDGLTLGTHTNTNGRLKADASNQVLNFTGSGDNGMVELLFIDPLNPTATEEERRAYTTTSLDAYVDCNAIPVADCTGQTPAIGLSILNGGDPTAVVDNGDGTLDLTYQWDIVRYCCTGAVVLTFGDPDGVSIGTTRPDGMQIVGSNSFASSVLNPVSLTIRMPSALEPEPPLLIVATAAACSNAKAVAAIPTAASTPEGFRTSFGAATAITEGEDGVFTVTYPIAIVNDMVSTAEAPSFQVAASAFPGGFSIAPGTGLVANTGPGTLLGTVQIIVDTNGGNPWDTTDNLNVNVVCAVGTQAEILEYDPCYVSASTSPGPVFGTGFPATSLGFAAGSGSTSTGGIEVSRSCYAPTGRTIHRGVMDSVPASIFVNLNTSTGVIPVTTSTVAIPNAGAVSVEVGEVDSIGDPAPPGTYFLQLIFQETGTNAQGGAVSKTSVLNIPIVVTP